MSNRKKKKKAIKVEDTTRMVVLSDICIGSDTYRPGLLATIAAYVKTTKNHFVLIAGGLFDGDSITKRIRRFTKELKTAQRVLKVALRRRDQAEKALIRLENARTKGPPKSIEESMHKKWQQGLNESIDDIKQEFDKFLAECEALEANVETATERLDSLSPESLAQLAATDLPEFTNAMGEALNIHIVPSEAYDKAIGDDACAILKKIRPDVRKHKPNNHRINLKQAGWKVTVIVPPKKSMPGLYDSTQPDKWIRKHEDISALETDFYIVGSCGVSIVKPSGEKTPYMVAPALCKTRERAHTPNQIGFSELVFSKQWYEPSITIHSLKDWRQEYKFVKVPKHLTRVQKTLVGIILKGDADTAGSLVEKANKILKGKDVPKLNAKKVEEALKPILTNEGYRPKVWCGLFRDTGLRYMPDLELIGRTLEFPPIPQNTVQDKFIAYSCFHAGSPFFDAKFFMRAMVRVALRTGATNLVGAGDFVQGIAHGMMQRGEVLGLDVTQQEALAGKVIAKVTNDIFNARFDQLLSKARKEKRSKGRLTHKFANELVAEALPRNLLLAGNHDAWSRYSAHRPMETLLATMKDLIASAMADKLSQHRVTPNFNVIKDAIESKVVVPADFETWKTGSGDPNMAIAKVDLPSGLRLAIMHPWMARALTISLRSQAMLKKAPDCHVIFGGNFHTACVVERWDPKKGQRVCVQLGTLLRGTPYETRLLKTVDFGFVYLEANSADGRITSTRSFFVNEPITKDSITNPDEHFNHLLELYDLVDSE